MHDTGQVRNVLFHVSLMALEGGDVSHVREYEIKLKQQKDSLQLKLCTLRQLDAEILALVAEE